MITPACSKYVQGAMPLPVRSTIRPTDEVAMIPAREAKVPQSPNIWPALPGAMSAIFATKPACPAEATAKLMKVSSKNAEGAQQTIHESQHCQMTSFT